MLKIIKNLGKNSIQSKFNFSSTLQRGLYNQIDQNDMTYFSDFLKPNEIITDKDEIHPFNIDWLKKYSGQCPLVLAPSTTQQISNILQYCNQRRLAIIPQGGNTGLVGGSVPLYDEIILSLKNLNKIIEYDENVDVLTCEAGCILENLQNFLAEKGCEMPLDLGAKGSCQIGGNIATHAGGINFVKHGPFRGNILGLEVILADGSFLDMQSKIRKDNTGYDIKQLFIGSEGTLGIISKANIQCYSKEKGKHLLIVKLKTFDDVLQLHKLSKKFLTRSLAAFEYFDSYAYEGVLDNLPNMLQPFQKSLQNKEYPYYCIVEFVNNDQEDLTLFENFYNYLDSNNVNLDDSLRSENQSQYSGLWKIREAIVESVNHIGPSLMYDVSISINDFDELTQIIRNKLGSNHYTVGYGHIGDGNLHISIACLNNSDIEETLKIVEPFIFDWVHSRNGSVSAEHGIGLMKTQYLQFSKSKETISYMKQIKGLFDPKNILNPYKVLP